MENEYKYSYQPIAMHFDGPNIDNGTDLHDLSIMLSNIHGILDKSFAVLAGQNRVSQKNRRDFKIIATDFRKGSLIIDSGLLITGASLALPALGFLNPESVWNYTCKAYSLLKTLYEAFKNGSKIHTEQTGENVNITITGNNNTVNVIQVPREVYSIAAKSTGNYQELTKRINETGISSINLSSLNDASCDDETCINLSLDQKTLFQTKSVIDDKMVSIAGDIIDFNKDKFSGRIRVYPGNEIPPGDYTFSIIGNQDQTPYIESMKFNSVSIKALCEYVLDPLAGTKIFRLQIIDIDLPKAS